MQTSHPAWVTTSTAEVIKRIAALLEANGGSLSPAEIRAALASDMSSARVNRALQIISLWQFAAHDEDKDLWTLVEPNWATLLEARTDFGRVHSRAVRNERERKVRKIRKAILQALTEAGELTEDELGKAIDCVVVDLFIRFLIKKKAVGKEEYNGTVRYFLSTSGPIDSITAGMAGLAVLEPRSY